MHLACRPARPAQVEQLLLRQHKADEVLELLIPELRVIVLMEARAKLGLRDVNGLWRKPVLGRLVRRPAPRASPILVATGVCFPGRDRPHLPVLTDRYALRH